MKIKPLILWILIMMVGSLSSAFAQNTIVSAEQVKAKMDGKQKAAVIDVRPSDEYAEAHVPGAVNIPLELMEKSRLPKDKSKPLIFYCRGVG